MLKIDNLSKAFSLETETISAFRGLRLSVDPGRFFAIVGPSGCGKSTLLRVIAGLIPPSSGKIIWDQPPTIGFVFQNYALFPYLTVFENIEFGLKMRQIPPARRRETVNQLIGKVGLAGFEAKHPKELSGGMKQRVGIARALALEPTVLLLDEPFSSLDEFTAESLRQLLLKLWQERQITIIMITHLIKEALTLADQIAVMSSSPGRLLAVVDNPLSRPRNPRSPEFFALEDKIYSLITDNPPQTNITR